MDNEIEGFTEEGEEREIREPRPFSKIERTQGKRDVTDFDIVKERLKEIKGKTTQIKKKKIKKAKISTALQKAIAAKAKQRRKEALQAAIARQKLLRGLRRGKEARPVNIMRNVTDRIPNVLIKRRDEEIKPTFIGKGGLL